MAWLSITCRSAKSAKGAPVEFVFPEEGVSAVTEPVAIIKGTKHAGSGEEVRRLRAVRKGPAGLRQARLHPGSRRCRHAGRFPARDKIKVLPLNAADALKNSEQDLKTFSDIFGSKG